MPEGEIGVSEVAAELSEALAGKVANVIEGFPASTDEEKAAIAEAVSKRLIDYANVKRGC